MIKKAMVTAMALGSFSQAGAVSLDFSEDLSVDVDVSINYGAAQRLKDQDPDLTSDMNTDDGNLGFDKGNLVNNKISSIIDIDLQYKDYGLFMRPRAFHDAAYAGTNANLTSKHNNLVAVSGELDSSDEFSANAVDLHRDTAEILDLFAYADFDVAGHYVDLRVGRQVVGWGESLYLQSGISAAQSPLDATASDAAGTTLSEIFLPVEQAYAQMDVTSNLSVSGYYQWKWKNTVLEESGTYFSDEDLMTASGGRYFIDAALDAAIDQVATAEASDSGQWGASARYIAEGLNDTEFGVYYMNYHDKTPMVVGSYTGGTLSPTAQAIGGTWNNLSVHPGADGIPYTADDVYLGAVDAAAAFGLDVADGSSYQIQYAENIKLAGASFGTNIGATNIGGEFSYRQGTPIKIVDAGNILGHNYVMGDAAQLQLSMIRVFSPTALWDSMTLTGEIGVNQVMGYGSSQLVDDKTAWGGTVNVAMDYFQVIPAMDVHTNVTYKFNPNGTSSVAGSFTEGEDVLTLGSSLTYKNVYQFGMSYTDYLNTASEHSLSDRDLLAVTASYTF